LALGLRVLTGLQALTRSSRSDSESQVGTLFHEVTHAEMFLRGEEAAMKTLVEKGTAYYRGAEIRWDETSPEPERLFREAVAYYVKMRVELEIESARKLDAIVARIQKGELRCQAALDEIDSVGVDYERKLRTIREKGFVGGYQLVGKIPFFTAHGMTAELLADVHRIVLRGQMGWTVAESQGLSRKTQAAIDATFDRCPDLEKRSVVPPIPGAQHPRFAPPCPENTSCDPSVGR